LNSILNISAYKFVTLNDAAALRLILLERATKLQLKGTILLAEEGINLFLAGSDAGVREFFAQLQADHRFADLVPKNSWSGSLPFKKIRVKLKTEIIRMNHPTIQPEVSRAPAVDAKTVKRWLDRGTDDSGRSVVTLDTRNAFEVAHGTFRGAIHWGISKFSDFPKALLDHKTELQGKTVVSFCTGGIRCEKAAILMRDAGLQNVYQLDGGILKYFENAGATHYQGDCFVFDERLTLDANLATKVV
jgi:UPF0176 protein